MLSTKATLVESTAEPVRIKSAARCRRTVKGKSFRKRVNSSINSRVRLGLDRIDFSLVFQSLQCIVDWHHLLLVLRQIKANSYQFLSYFRRSKANLRFFNDSSNGIRESQRWFLGHAGGQFQVSRNGCTCILRNNRHAIKDTLPADDLLIYSLPLCKKPRKLLLRMLQSGFDFISHGIHYCNQR